MSDDDRARMIHETTRGIARHVIDRRIAAHAKHGDNSIEAVNAEDFGKWLAILGEEFGEVCHELTYDALVNVNDGKPLSSEELRRRRLERLQGELYDLVTVGTAWLAGVEEALALPS